MIRNPKISVIIPLYNAEAYIGRTLDSVLNQTFEDYEVIMINDCPSDRTIEIAGSYKDTRLRIIHNMQNMGIAYSRNLGITYSSGEYIALIDHDDIAMPYRFEKQAAFLDEHKDIAIVGGATQWIDEHDNPLTDPTIVLQNPKELRAMILFYNVYWNCEVMFRRKVVESGIQYHDLCYGMEDFRFWIEASVEYKMSNIPELVLQHRAVRTSETNRIKNEEYSQKMRKFEILRDMSFRQSGYRLRAMERSILNKILNEERTGYCMNKEEEEIFVNVMNTIVNQAAKMQVEYLAELKQICAGFVMEKTGEVLNCDE